MPRRGLIGTRPHVPILNRDSPQAQGLLAHWAPSPISTRDSVRGLVLTPESTTPAFKAVPGGQGIYDNASTAGWKLATPPSDLLRGNAFTLTCHVWFDGSGDSNASLFGIGYSIPWGNPYYTGFVTNGSAFNLYFQGFPVTSVAAGAGFYVLSGSLDASNVATFRVNGLPSVSGASNTQGYSASSAIVIGDPAENGRATNCTVLDARIYAKAFTDQDHWELYDPATRWDLYWQKKKSYIVLGGGASPQTVTPSSATATWTVGAPTLATPLTFTPASVSAAWNVGAPSLLAALTVAPSSVLAQWTIGAPGITSPLTLSPLSVLAEWTIDAPGVSAGASPISLTPGSVLATWVVPDPTLAASVVLAPNSVTANWTFGVPGLNTSVVLAPSSVTAAWGIDTPALVTPVIVAPDSTLAYWVIDRPTVVGGSVTFRSRLLLLGAG